MPHLSKPLTRIVTFLGISLLASVAALAFLYCSDLLSSSQDQNAFEREVGKTLLQIIAVAVLGTTASLLLAEFNREQAALQQKESADREREQQKENSDREREQEKERSERAARERQKEIDRLSQEKDAEIKRRERENNDQLRKEILRKTDEIYASAKRARRLLRARAFAVPYYRTWDDNAPVLLEVYDKYIEEINEAQLQLEIIAKDIETNEQAFSNVSEVVGYIRPMEEYLGRVIKEYEQMRSRFKGEPRTLPIRDLKELRDMLGPTESGRFDRDFIDNHKQLLASIRRDLIAWS